MEEKPTTEITVELTSVKGVTKDNFDAIVSKLELMFGPKLQEVCNGLIGDSIWPLDLSPEEQRKGLENEDEIQLFFMKARE